MTTSSFGTWELKSSTSPIASVPTEIILRVIDFLDQIDVKHFILASKHLRRIGGPMIYQRQYASDVNHLVRLQVLASQLEVAAMIRNVEIDTVDMDYWWQGISRLLEDALPKLKNLETFRIRLSHLISPSLSSSLSRIPTLHTLSIELRDVPLGPHVRSISHLRHIELDLAPPNATYFPTVSCAFGDMVGFISSSQATLESLSLYAYTTECTAGFVKHLAPSGSLEKVLHACPNLNSLSIRLEVSPNLQQTVEAVDALAGLPVTALHLKSNPTMFPEPSADGYGLGVEVLERIREKLPMLKDLRIQDGEMGRANLASRPGDGSIFERHIKCLTHLKQLALAEFPLLLDDVLLHNPSNGQTDAQDSASGAIITDPTPPLSPLEKSIILESAPNPRLQFETNIQDILAQTVHSTLLRLSRDDQGYPDEDSQPILPHLEMLKFRLFPTPQLARDLRGLRMHVPSISWFKRVQREELDGRVLVTLVDI